MGNRFSSRRKEKRLKELGHLATSLDSLYLQAEASRSSITQVKVNHGAVYSGNTFRYTFTDCQNVTVSLHPVDMDVEPTPTPRKKRSQSYANDLAELKESLILLYKSEESWLDPIPWEDSKKFEPEDYFIYIDIEELDRKGKKVLRHKVPVDCILEPVDSTINVAPKRVLLQAEAGFGKTTTCIKIAFDWATKTKTNFNKFDLVIYLRLRCLVGSLEDYIADFAVAACKNNIAKERMREVLSRLKGRLLLLLDGLDECSEVSLKSVNQVLGFDRESSCQSYLRLATIMVTTRPTLVSKMTVFTDRHIRIISMSTEERDKFVRNYFESTETSESVLSMLSRENFRWDLSPLMLFLICYLEEEGQLSSLQQESQVFNQILNLLSKRYFVKEGLEGSDNELKICLGQLGKLCFELLKRKTMFFRADQVIDYCTCPVKFVLGCGLFRKEFSYAYNLEDTYEPVHKRFVEHLAALYLQRECDKIVDPVKKLEFVKHILQRPSRRYRKVVVYETERENKIFVQSCICEGVLDVYITAVPAKIRSTKKISVEILLYSESIVRLQDWRSFKSPLYFQANVALVVPTDDKAANNLKCIPKRFRDEVGLFCDEFGCVFCELMLHKICACSTDTDIFRKETTRVMTQLVSFNYKEEDVACRNCSFHKRSDLVNMILAGESHATAFTLSRSPARILDTLEFLSKLCSQDLALTRNLTTSVRFFGNVRDISSVLVYSLTVSGVPSTTFGSFMFESNGMFLTWVLQSFGFSERNPDKFLPLVDKHQCLRITYGSGSHSFMKDSAGLKTFCSPSDAEPKLLTTTFIKKLVQTWSSETSDIAFSSYGLVLLNEEKKLTCNVTIATKHCQEGCKECDFLTWYNWKL